MQTDTKISKYVDAITNEAKTASYAVEQHIKDYKIEQIDKIKEAAKAESEREIARRCDVIHEDIGRRFSEDETAARRTIFEKRDEIKSSVFKKAKKQLIDFTESPEYKSFLVNSINNIKSVLAGMDKVITVYLKPSDLKFKDDIESAASFPCDFIADESIEIGGIRVKFSKLVIDDTLDSRLSAQTEWFEETSGLDIK